MTTTQPELGQRLEALRFKAKNGKRMSRGDFAKLIEISPGRLRNIEMGHEPRGKELDKILIAFPELASTAGVLQPEPTKPSDETHPDVSTAMAPYCDCRMSTDSGVSLREGWTRNEDDDWVCGRCGRISKMVWEQRTSEEKPYGDLHAVDEDEVLDAEDEILEAFTAEASTTEAPSAVAVIESTSDTESALPSQLADLSPFANSEIQTFKRCRRKWWLGWYRGLKLRIEDPYGARGTGNRVHRALKALYVPGDQIPQDPREALERAIVEDWTKYASAFAARGVEPPEEVVKRFNDDISLERAMVSGYVEWLATSGEDQGLHVVAPETYLEVPFEVPMGDYTTLVKLIGKLDVRVLREVDGVRLFIDHKTVGDLTSPMKTLHLNEQMLHYHVLEWLAEVESGRCDGALYNMLRKVKRTARANPPFYGRVEVRHNEHELEAYKRQLQGVIREILIARERIARGEDPGLVAYKTATKDCSWDCDFFGICPMFDDGSRVDDAITQLYTEADPHGYYKDEE